VKLGDIASIRLSNDNNIGGSNCYPIGVYYLPSFVEDYIIVIKELTEKMLAQLSIPQTFVNGLLPKYMTSKGVYVKVVTSKNEM